MAETILKNILTFEALVVGVPSVQPHLLVITAAPVSIPPDLVMADKAGFTVTADATNVTVTRTASALSGDCRVYVERWHSLEDATPLRPASFVAPTIPFVVMGNAGPAVGATAPNSAMFFGTTTGTGSLGNDYAATVAVGAAVPFPRAGPATAGADTANTSATQKTLARSGKYQVSWQVGFTEASQLQVAIGGVAVAGTTAVSGAGTQQNSNTVIITAVAANVLTIINPAGNATALTVTPSDGSLTHAQAPNLIIEFLGA